MASISTVPEDIFINIVSRVDSKSAGRSRCVCKRWGYLLSTNFFAQQHIQFHHLEEKAIGNDGLGNVRTIELCSSNKAISKLMRIEFHNDHREVYVVGACRGLVLATAKMERLVVVNFTTCEYVILRDMPNAFDHYKDDDFVTVYGIGYDGVSDDYVVAALYNFNPYDPPPPRSDHIITHAYVYRLTTGTWRKFENFPDHYAPRYYNSNSSVVLNGAIHWLVHNKLDLDNLVILAFDVHTEEFTEIPVLHNAEHIANWGGMLCMVSAIYGSHGTNDPGRCDVWAMTEYGVHETWKKIYTFEGIVPLFLGFPFPSMQPRFWLSNPQRIIVERELGTWMLKDASDWRYWPMEIDGWHLYKFYCAGYIVDSVISPKSYRIGT